MHVRSRQVCAARAGASSILNGLSVEQRRPIWHQLLVNNDGIFRLVAERNATFVRFGSIATPSRDEDATEQTCRGYSDLTTRRASVAEITSELAGLERADRWGAAPRVRVTLRRARAGRCRGG